MCVVSNIGDDWKDKFYPRWPQVPQNPVYPIPEISRSEFDALKREMEELKKLLQQAKKFDEATGQKDCQMEEKIAFIKKMADALGIDISDLFPTKKPKKK